MSAVGQASCYPNPTKEEDTVGLTWGSLRGCADESHSWELHIVARATSGDWGGCPAFPTLPRVPSRPSQGPYMSLGVNPLPMVLATPQLCRTIPGQTFLLVVASYMKWLEVVPVSITSFQIIMCTLRKLFSTHGLHHHHRQWDSIHLGGIPGVQHEIQNSTCPFSALPHPHTYHDQWPSRAYAVHKEGLSMADSPGDLEFQTG